MVAAAVPYSRSKLHTASQVTSLLLIRKSLDILNRGKLYHPLSVKPTSDLNTARDEMELSEVPGALSGVTYVRLNFSEIFRLMKACSLPSAIHASSNLYPTIGSIPNPRVASPPSG